MQHLGYMELGRKDGIFRFGAIEDLTPPDVIVVSLTGWSVSESIPEDVFIVDAAGQVGLIPSDIQTAIDEVLN